VLFDPRAETYPVTNERTGIEDNNVVGLTLSPSYPSDSTLFAASGVAGLYKNTSLFTFPMTGCNTSPHWPGYFYRMIGDPDSWGIVPVRAVRTVPNYDNNAGYPFRTLFAASPGHGVLRSYDGGRSWGYANGDGNELAGAEVTDLLVDPSSASILYAAVYGKGVYRSSDGGASWALLLPSGLTNKKVLALALGGSTLYAGCRSASGEYGLWSYSTGWQNVTASVNLSVSTLATPKPSEWGTYPWVFAGTEASGVYGFKTSAPVSFTALSTNLPANARIYDLKVSPAFVTAQRLLAAVKPTNTTNGGVYWGTLVTTPSPSIAWSQITTGLTDRRVTAVAFNPDYSIGGEIFCGHAFKGVYIASHSGSGLQCNWKPAAGFYNVPPAIEALAVSPEDGGTVFAASSMDGVFISRDGGDTFQPWGGFASPIGDPGMPETISVAVTGTVYLNESFQGGGLPSGWVTVNGGTTGGLTWSTSNPAKPTGCTTRGLGSMVPPSMMIDSQCDGAGKTQDDKLVTPELDTSGAQTLRLVFYDYYNLAGDSDFAYVKVCSSATGGSCDPATGTSWTTVLTTSSGSGNLPDRGVSLTAYKGTGFRVMFHYAGAFDYYWAVDDVRLVDTGTPATGRPSVVVGTRNDGIYYSAFGEDTYFGSFIPSSLTTGRIREIRYTNMAEDLRAADADGGDWHSRDYGRTWTLISDFGGANIADMSYGSGLTLAESPERGLNTFIWGASSGKSLGTTLRAELCNNLGQAWYRSGGYSTIWTACPTTGLNICEDFRSILQLTTVGHKDVLMGSTGIGSNPADPEWKGLYRAPSSCGSWTASNEGLPCTTSGEKCVNTAQVWALWQNPDSGDPFILASVTDDDDSDANGDQGGVYYSDWFSYGKAWAKTNLPTPEPGSVDLASSTGGTTIYTGLADDGVFSSVPASITVLNATAYFEAAAEACVGTSVTFSDYSAGQITEYAWDFGDGQSCAGPTGNTCSPTAWGPAHTFASASTFTVTETVENGYGHTDAYSRGITIRAELDVANTLRASKTATPGQVRLTWTDITGETGYGVWGANAASGSGKSLRASLAANTVQYDTSESYAYWRIQPLSGTYICGNGIVGGSW
jgi:PKD repeat protein